jgi:hypothetical protein
MSDLLPTNSWEISGVFGSSTPLCELSAPKDAYANDGWDSLDGDLQLFLAIEELLTGESKAYWKNERLDWDLGSSCRETATARKIASTLDTVCLWKILKH